jgi:hypothetical protein
VSGAARSGFQLRGLALERRDGFGHRSCLQERHLIERTVSHVSAGCICGSSTFCTLTNRSSQPLAGVTTRFDFMKQFPMFATLAPASGG